MAAGPQARCFPARGLIGPRVGRTIAEPVLASPADMRLFLDHQTTTAFALAVLYAALGIGGRGLHALTHGDSCCEAQVSACGCGEELCFFDRFLDGEAEQRQTADTEPAAFRVAGGESHDPHTCGVCRLLAQLKTGYQSPATAASRTAATESATVSAAAAPASAFAPSLGARGPPAIG